MRVFNGRQFHRRCHLHERKLQFLRKIEGSCRGHRFIEGLQLLEGLVGAFDGLLAAALDMVPEDGPRTKKRGKRRDVLALLPNEDFPNDSGKLPVNEQFLSCKRFVHGELSSERRLELPALKLPNFVAQRLLCGGGGATFFQKPA